MSDATDERADDMGSPKAGDRVAYGRYQIVQERGRGTMGVVFEAVDLCDGSRVAIKVLHPRVRDDASLRRRFHREARCGRRLGVHPNLVAALDHGLLAELGDLPYMSMPFVRGPTLSQLLALEGSLRPERAAALMAGVARGLVAAHRFGVVHRDVKPDNILVDTEGGREVARVVDFGLAVRVGTGPGDPGRLTRSHHAPGTPFYMAPEQIGRVVVLPALDVHAVGATLFTTLIGAPPPPVRDSGPVEPDPRLPEQLGRLVAACLDPAPFRRPRMGQVAARLEALAGGRPAAPAARRRGRRWPLALIAVVSGLAGAASAAVATSLVAVSSSTPTLDTGGGRAHAGGLGCYAVRDIMTEFTSDDKDRLFCEVVAQLIISDAKVTDSEREFLERLMDRFGLDDVGKRAVINSVNIGEPVGPRLQRLDAETRRALLSELEAAAAVDGEIGASELSIIEEVRNALDEAG